MDPSNKREGVLDRFVWIRARRLRAPRVISKPRNESWGSCESCELDGFEVQRGGNHRWCIDCAVLYGPHARDTFYRARLYEQHAGLLKQKKMPPLDSPLVEDIQMLAVLDEWPDSKIGKTVGLKAELVTWVRDYYRIPGYETSNRGKAIHRVPLKFSYKGQRRTLRGWAEQMGLAEQVLYGRLRMGWPIERALTAPVRKRRTKVEAQAVEKEEQTAENSA